MQIVNYIKDSTVECSPFNWGLTLFSFGCNFHCKMCEGYNYEKVTNKDNIIGTAKDIIEKNITPMHDCVVFLGGEPTIWGDKLLEALNFCHEKGLKTKIFSNGFNSSLIERINRKKLCDAWSIDFKVVNKIQQECGVHAADYLINVNKSIFDIINNKFPLEIRTTYYSGNYDQKESIEEYVKSTFLRIHPEVKYIEQEDVRDII